VLGRIALWQVGSSSCVPLVVMPRAACRDASIDGQLAGGGFWRHWARLRGCLKKQYGRRCGVLTTLSAWTFLFFCIAPPSERLPQLLRGGALR
jgi:hypothetical protein